MLGAAAELGRGPWLDLGCGTGLLHAYLLERGHAAAPIVGVDFSRGMLARAHGRGVPVAAADSDGLPFPDGAFGAVLAFTVLGIVPDTHLEQRTLAEVARVLRPGGTFVATLLQVNHDGALAERLHAAGFGVASARACGQDVGYRCVRLRAKVAPENS